ncbi:hypothetical protein O3M35_003691 [Rhynocoris fuscipes]|uniref:Uncharacterized protein n=1 Tax=Rhynocoris fuscipes TaxID=488301 RepID=A0AAW1CRL4_9HEMI
MSRSVARRKTDLTPTVPQSASSREAMCSPTPTSGGSRTPRSTKTHPGRAYSMSRLDILAAPRRPKLTTPPTAQQQQQSSSLRRSTGTGSTSVYRSMSLLPGTSASATGTTIIASNSKLGPKGAGHSRSMLQLGGAGPIPPPRPTRAEKLRRKAREQAASARSPSSDQHSPGMYFLQIRAALSHFAIFSPLRPLNKFLLISLSDRGDIKTILFP